MKRKKTKPKEFYKRINIKYFIPAVFLILAGIFYFSPVRGIVAQKLAVQGKYYFNGETYDLDKAVKWYKAAAFVDDKSWIAHYQLARIYFVKNDLKTALSEIDKALAVDPKNKRAYYVRGLIDGYAKNFKASEDDFQKYVDYYQKEWAGYNDLAWAYYQDKEYKKAVDTAFNGLEVAPDNPWLLNGLGVSYDALGEKEKGKAALEKVATIAKDMTAVDWRKAYPGNNPETADWDLAQFRVDVGVNLNLTSLKFPSGQGKFAAACGGVAGTTGICSGCTCNWGYQCDQGDDPYGHSHYAIACSAGCGSDAQCCPPPPCSDSSWSPDPSTVCAGVSFTQTSNCGSTRGAWGSATCNGACGGASGGAPSCALGSPLCSAGSPSAVSPPSPWNWVCVGVGPGHIDPSCSHDQLVVNAQCGNSSGGGFCVAGDILAPCKGIPSFPVSNPDGLTHITNPPGINLVGSNFSWSCSSDCNGSSSGACTATKLPTIVPKCGSADGGTFCEGAPSSNLCAQGTASVPTGGRISYEDWSWTCSGQCDGPAVSCSAKGKGSCGWVETN
jgi:hypothetical protein